MKLQWTTWILVLLALSLGGFVYFSETKPAPQQETATIKERKIFDFDKDQIQSFTIKTPEQLLKFERVQQAGTPASKTPWQMKFPVDTPASDPSVTFLVNLLVNAKSDRILTVAADEIQQYGLDQPQAIVEIKLKNQQTHQLILGKSNFNNTFLYAQADPPADKPQQRQLVLLTKDLENAVQRPLSEWQSKPASNEKSQTNSKKSPPEQPKLIIPSP
ncbi:MAG TPA: DUF4340 domain-containing protein [Oculatellaceae cyanobacterium]|jgi:hypothetical protein